ncbi:hypothetical protein HYFRA_00006238 [Hymenoscyphus fraxineus]|uniref:Lytic polysaccharide monooxygenase n=1 Tax=Hymenoscyphus fraxineus TaxID=746836 RepID=A0A9N9LBU1_9HELO|nr:hypothetical protein HYFRA_00006238 [Hymenoscyphus fraxineus]
MHIPPLLLLLPLTHAHIVLKTPKPFKFPAYGPSNPIDPTNPDWPCKLPSGVGSLIIDGTPTPITAGVPQTLSFERGNGAVHGGGSCQVSLLPGFAPSKENADFRVIKSWEGGCPARNQEGNLRDGEEAGDYEFVVPREVGDGEFTFAWTWIQRIGGTPEFYQNCAPITISGGSNNQTSSSSFLQTLPPVFMANMGPASHGCVTSVEHEQRKAVRYPNPGKEVEYPEGEGNLFGSVAGCDGNPFAKGGGKGNGDEKQPVNPAAHDESKGTSTQAKPSSSKSKPSSSPPPKKSSPSPSTSISTPNPSTKPNPNSKCQEGTLRCNPGQTPFSTCTGGQFRAPIPLAAGTRCKGGVGVGLEIENVG